MIVRASIARRSLPILSRLFLFQMLALRSRLIRAPY